MLDELSSVAFANAADFVEITGEGRVQVKPDGSDSEKKTRGDDRNPGGFGRGGNQAGQQNAGLADAWTGISGAFAPETGIEDLEAARAEVFGDEGAADE